MVSTVVLTDKEAATLKLNHSLYKVCKDCKEHLHRCYDCRTPLPHGHSRCSDCTKAHADKLHQFTNYQALIEQCAPGTVVIDALHNIFVAEYRRRMPGSPQWNTVLKSLMGPSITMPARILT